VPAPAPAPAEPAVGDSAVLPVYFAGEHDGRWWLYREFQRLPVTDGAVISASVAASLAGSASDPDYGTRWPGVQLLGVAREGDVVTVELSGPSASAAELAAQQIVYTVTATDPTVSAVRLIGPGVGSPGDAPVSRAPQQDVVAPVWIIEPGEGATIDGSITVSGDASVLEANVTLEVRQGDRIVEQTFATATEGAPGRGTWEATLTLSPGDYEIWAYESSLEDGSVRFPDTRRITVR
jgi:Immunoglobulin-like domain of bacterial spore germination/Sporulation and spore germination